MVSEGVHHALTDESRRIMAEASIIPPILNYQELAGRIEAESRGEVENVKVKCLSPAFGISKGGRTYTNLIAISVSFETPLKLPRIFRENIGGERTALSRAFVGASQSGAVKPFSEMEQDDGSGAVWIFPKAGERYHKQDCSYIANNPREVLLDRNVRRLYDPCKLCKPGDGRDGSLVYCFETSGKAYHTGDCYIVDRYVIKVSKDDAEKQGYTPCSKCGGGG